MKKSRNSIKSGVQKNLFLKSKRRQKEGKVELTNIDFIFQIFLNFYQHIQIVKNIQVLMNNWTAQSDSQEELNDTVARTYICFCQKKFTTYPGIYLHMKSKHSNLFLRYKKLKITKLFRKTIDEKGGEIHRLEKISEHDTNHHQRNKQHQGPENRSSLSLRMGTEREPRIHRRNNGSHAKGKSSEAGRQQLPARYPPEMQRGMVPHHMGQMSGHHFAMGGQMPMMPGMHAMPVHNHPHGHPHAHNPGHVPGHAAGHNSSHTSSHTPGHAPNQIPGHLPGHLPNHMPGHIQGHGPAPPPPPGAMQGDQFPFGMPMTSHMHPMFMHSNPNPFMQNQIPRQTLKKLFERFLFESTFTEKSQIKKAIYNLMVYLDKNYESIQDNRIGNRIFLSYCDQFDHIFAMPLINEYISQFGEGRETKKEEEESESREVEMNCIVRFSNWVMDLMQNQMQMRRGMGYPLREMDPVRNVVGPVQEKEKEQGEKEGHDGGSQGEEEEQEEVAEEEEEIEEEEEEKSL